MAPFCAFSRVCRTAETRLGSHLAALVGNILSRLSRQYRFASGKPAEWAWEQSKVTEIV
jgi:hypothetical protein